MQNRYLTRREALQRVIGVSLALAALELPSSGAPVGAGIGRDANLLKKEIPWPLVMTEAELKAAKALADVLLPADDLGPAASTLGIAEFIDEWVSAPYDPQSADRVIIQKGLAWLDAESNRRHGKVYAELAAAQMTALVDDIIKEGTEARRDGFAFFQVFRDRSMCGYFSTPEGWKAIGYVGNKPLAEFPGPPPEVLQHLGLS